MLHTWGEGSSWKKNLHWNIRLNEAHWDSGTVKKQACDTLHGPTWGPHFILDSPRTRERDRDTERGEIKRGRGGGRVCAFALLILPPLSIFVSSFCARSTHTLAVQWIFYLALISCVPDETNTDSLFTFVKAPAAAVLVPQTHTVRAHKHAPTHTQPLNPRPSPAGAYRKSRLCTKWPWLHWATLCVVLSCFSHLHDFSNTHTLTVCVMFR